MQAKLFPGSLDIGRSDISIASENALPIATNIEPVLLENLVHFVPTACLMDVSSNCSPYVSPTTAPATGELTGSTRPNHGSLMAMPEIRVKDDPLQRIPWGSASVKSSYDKVHTSWNGNTTSSCACPLFPKDSGTFPGLDVSGLVPYNDGEQDHTLKMNSNTGGWPSPYLLPFSELPAKDDHLQEVPLGIASPNCLTGLVHTPWDGNTVSSYSQLPLLKYDGTTRGLHVPGSALHGDGERCHTLGRGPKAEQGPSEYCVPPEYLPDCRSNPRRRRRRFTNGEKAVISYKRKIGVCGDCRQAKRKASL